MKKFNLKKALEGVKVVTRDGREVTDITLGIFEPEYIYGNINDETYVWYVCGSYKGKDISSEYDLFMAEKPKKKRVWVNMYNFCSSVRPGHFTWYTKESAKNAIQAECQELDIDESKYNGTYPIIIESEN